MIISSLLDETPELEMQELGGKQTETDLEMHGKTDQ